MPTKRTTLRLSDERQQLLEQEEYWKAAQTVSEWNEWLRECKDLQELRERFNHLEKQHERMNLGGRR